MGGGMTEMPVRRGASRQLRSVVVPPGRKSRTNKFVRGTPAREEPPTGEVGCHAQTCLSVSLDGQGDDRKACSQCGLQAAPVRGSGPRPAVTDKQVCAWPR